MQLGGRRPGDRYHNVLFQNPGQGNNWLTVKLIGKKTNRAAIGARIKVVTAGDEAADRASPRLAAAAASAPTRCSRPSAWARPTRSPLLEIFWPTSGTTQVFRDVAVNQAIEVTEFATDYRKLNWKRVPLAGG